MAGALTSRLPTMTVILLTAVFFALLTLLVLPKPESFSDKHSVRAKLEAEAALREANESIKVAETMPRPEILAEGVGEAKGTEPDPHTITAIQPEISHDDTVKLETAPISAVTEETPDGVLPMIARDGRQPWQVYARPFAYKKTPHIVLIIAGLAGDTTIVNAAIERLPGTVTLAFDAAWAGKEHALTRARQAGHETLLTIPAEPFDYPNSDPGPDTLLSNLTAKENIRRLQGFMSQGAGYVGLMTLTGTRFVSVPSAVGVLLDEMSRRGLALLDARLTERGGLAEQAARIKLPVAAVDYKITSDMAAGAINQVLTQAEAAAKKSGQAICLVMATPLVIDHLNHWLLGLPNSGIKVAPFSSVLQ